MTTAPIAFIGGGNMARSLIGGLVARGTDTAAIRVSEPVPALREALQRDFGIGVVAGNADAVTGAGTWVLAVKPQIIDEVLETLAPVIGPNTLALSIAAGIDIARLSRGLGMGRVVRTMPNTPAQIGKGITGAVAGPDVSAGDRDAASALLSAAGPVVWFDDERQLDVVTAISGSGPAYVFHLVEALAAAGKKMGLSDANAELLARQTVIGSAALLEADPAPPAVLRANVTSPNGTTAAGLAVLMEGLTPLIEQTTEAARRRSEELGRS